MSANGARNRVVVTGVRIEAVHSKQTAKDYTGKPDLPCVNIGEPQRAEGAPRNTPPKVSRLSLICADTGSSSRDAKVDGKEERGERSPKGRCPHLEHR